MERLLEQLDVEVAGMTSGLLLLIILLVVWSMIWKAVALWKAARRDAVGWYIVLWFLNTAGILEIIYIFAVAPKQAETGQQPAGAF